MENNKIKIIFAGTPEFGAIILDGLINAKYSPILVITAKDKPKGRKKILTPPPVKVLAERYRIPVAQPEKIINLKSQIFDLKPDLMIVAAYGQILPKEILEIPKYGCLNIHPSLLPSWRGPSPIQYTILNGDKKTGVTIIKMTEKVDAGPIVAQKELNFLTGKETFEMLNNKLAKLGAELLIETIPRWLKGEIKLKPQDESKATYSKILTFEDGKIDWKKPIDYIDRQVRALNPEPGTYTFYKGKILKILETEIQNNKLIIKKVHLAGKKPMSFEEFLRGHPDFSVLNSLSHGVTN